MNGLQTLGQWRSYFDEPTKGLLGTMNAMYPVGKIGGVTLSALIGDKFGRKVPLYIGLSILLLGAALQGSSQNIPMFIVARLILGFGTAFVAQTSPILITELAFPTHRGRATSLYFSTYVSPLTNEGLTPVHFTVCQILQTFLTNVFTSTSVLLSQPGPHMAHSGFIATMRGEFPRSCKQRFPFYNSLSPG